MLLLINTLFVVSVWAQSSNKSNCKVEIYLINDSWHVKRKVPTGYAVTPENYFFIPKRENFKGDVFIKDEEILGYRIEVDSVFDNSKKPPVFFGLDTICFLKIRQSAKEKISGLEMTLVPIRYAVVLNDKPIIGAYFWNPRYHDGCNWVLTPLLDLKNLPDELQLRDGKPFSIFNRTKKDPRLYQPLLDCLRKTNRLTIQY